ncbi:alpha-2-macroglobulin family protein [Haliscomenobacter sp.]|uniref:alpha-2-macroglobulin family protein n=1 Tax=Haliscomenobacter sp. TaxID=2717303 RepID=UPI003593EA36
MKQLYLALGILLQFNSLILFAQKTQEWHYNLSPQVARQLFLGKWLDTSMMGQPLPVASFDNIPIQHHLLVQNKAEEIQLSLQAKANFTVRAMAIGPHLSVQIIDAHGKIIKSAKVALDGVSLPFEAGLNLYRRPNLMPARGTLSVTLGEHTFYYQFSTNKVTPPKPVAAPSREQSALALRGYIAFCKPVFRHRDTLKAKIYAAKPNGKPYSGKLLVELKTTKLWWDTLVSVERGAFSFELPLSDTLALDQTYTLSAKALDKNIRQALIHTFHLEDYQLNEVQYNLFVEKDKFHAGEKIKLNLVAQTVYNIAVPDADVRLGCQSYGKTVNPFWDYQSKLGEAGELEIEIPAEVLPKTPSLIKVRASFSRPGEALQTKEISFWYNPVAIDLYVDNSKLHAHAYGQPYQLWAEYDWGRQLLYAGQEPLIVPINPEVQAYSAGFEKPVTYLNLQNEELDAVADQLVLTYRNLKNKQSITLHNPLGVSIWYQIGYKGQTIQEGWTQDTLFRWTQQDKRHQDLYLHYQYWWGSKLQVQDRLIPYQKQQLQMEWIAPEQIYPGQNLDLQLSVRDERGRAVAGVDITAGAINAQFADDLPHSPLALTTDQELPLAYWDVQVVPSKKEWRQPLDLSFYKKLESLHSDSYYSYRFVENGFLSDAIPLDATWFYQQNAFFAPFVVKQGKVQPVLMVYVNDTLTYFGGSAGSANYHFCSTPGYKSIGVRTKEGRYELDSIYLERGNRLNLIVDALNFKNSAAHKINFSPMPDTLVNAEKELLAQSMLLTSEIGGGYAWDNFGHSYSRKFSTGLLGPFTPGSTIQFVQPYYRKKVFEFPLVGKDIKDLKMPEPYHFNRNNVWVDQIPSFFDPYTIPLIDHTVQEAYNLSGFRIVQPGSEREVDDFCLQTGTDGMLRGRMVDENRDPLIGTTILIKQTNQGAVSDIDGYFALNMAGFANHQIQISFVGYVTRDFQTCQTEMPLSGDIVLQESTDFLSEVIVVGYGVQKKMEMTASISTVSSRSMGRQKSSNRTRPTKPEKIKPSFEASALLNPLTKGIRTHFSDYAFWQPKLITDSEGKARFSVKFPDNITSWQSFAIGMDQDGEMGLGLKNIAAFKPLQAQLYTPRFLVAGDQVQLNAKVINLVSSPTLIHTQFKQNGQTLQDSNWIAPAHANLTQVVTAPAETDSLTLEFGLQTGQYIDGEARDLPIIPIGRMKPYGQFIEITQDTTIILPFTPGTRTATLTLEPGGVLKLMLDDIKYLKNYHFGCNEQTSSKLTALLLEKSLRGMLGEKFADEQDIYKGIEILEGRQQAEGGWSWWVSGQQRYWTTNYVLKALLRAAQAGYPVTALKKGLEFLQKQLPQMTEEDYLVSLETLTKAGVKVDLTRLQREPAAAAEQDLLYKKLLRQYLLQAQGLPYSLDTLFKYQRVVDNRLGTYWDGREIFGFAGYRVADCSTQNTLIGYSILKKAGKAEELKKIRSYFLDNRGFHEGNYRYGGRWNNTMEVAKILEAILPDLMEEDKKDRVGNRLEKKAAGSHRVIALDQTTISLKLQQQDTFFIKLDKKTTSAYLTYVQYTSQVDSTQKRKDNTFEVKSQLFAQGQQPLAVLRLNEPVSLQVDVQVKRAAKYVMVEIPIPAGCTYFDKNEARSHFEVHREYHADRVLIFCDELPAWNHQFRVQLLPQFAGSFTLNPVWVEDMYHPLENGTNTVRKVEIME